jgi:hypothetical protein
MESSQRNNAMWSSLDVDFDVFTFSDGASGVELSILGSEWDSGYNSTGFKSVSDESVDWDFSILEELQECNFGTITYWNKMFGLHLDVSSIVIHDVLLDVV